MVTFTFASNGTTTKHQKEINFVVKSLDIVRLQPECFSIPTLGIAGLEEEVLLNDQIDGKV